MDLTFDEGWNHLIITWPVLIRDYSDEADRHRTKARALLRALRKANQ